MTQEEIRLLIGKLTIQDGAASFEDVAKVVSEAENIRHRAFLKDLLSLMHLYGIYWHIGGSRIPEPSLASGGYEIGIEADGDVCSDTRGDMTKEAASYNDIFILPINPPTAHQKMERAAHNRRLLERYLTETGEETP